MAKIIIDTLMNTLYAFMWPVFVLQWNQPWGVAVLVAIFVFFPKLMQKPVEHWLFEGEPPPPKDDKQKADKKAEKKA